MLRTVNAQPTLWEALLPEMCLGMPAELEAVDRLLDDAASSTRSGPTSTLFWVGPRFRSKPICGSCS